MVYQRKTRMSAEMVQAGRISKAFEKEPIVFVRTPPGSQAKTKKWKAVEESLSPSPVETTNARRIMDAYQRLNPGSSIGTPHIALLISKGHLAFQDPHMRLLPGGVAFRMPAELPTPAQPELPAVDKAADDSPSYETVGTELVAWQELTEELMGKGIKYVTFNRMMLGMQLRHTRRQGG